jgi:uncharacterized protein YqeY
MSNLIETLQAELKESLKEGDRERTGALRFLLSEIHNARIEKQEELEDADVVSVLKKQAKKRRESIDAFREGGRDDLVEKETRELEVIEKHLPEQMGEDEVRDLLRSIITEEGLGGMSDMGRLMKNAMERLKGQADGSLVSRLASEELQRSGD